MKKLLFATLCTLAVLTSCETPKNDNVGSTTFKRADISGAKFLTLAGGSDNRADSESNAVYKIDENGNMTAVVFYVEMMDHDGNKSIENVSQDIKVIPTQIVDFGKEYLLFADCKVELITDKYKDFYYSMRNPFLSFLVRKSDGAIFEIDESQRLAFPKYNNQNWPDFDPLLSMQLTYNIRGEIYMVGADYQYRNVSKLKVENEKLLLQQITTGISVKRILIDKNDNLYVDEYDDTKNLLSANGYMYFADGSVVTIPSGPDNNNDYRKIFLIDNEYYIIDMRRMPESNYYTYKLDKISSLTPNVSFTEVATLTAEDLHFNKLKLHNSVYLDIEDKTMFYDPSYSSSNPRWCLVYTKSTQKLSEVPLLDGFNEVRFNRQGIAYEYSKQNCTQITKYNIVDMTKKIINCDRSAVPPFIATSANQTSSDFFEFGILSSNGAPIRVQTNLETGKVTVHEDADDRTITELIRVS